jgi:hypothetical protein
MKGREVGSIRRKRKWNVKTVGWMEVVGDGTVVVERRLTWISSER